MVKNGLEEQIFLSKYLFKVGMLTDDAKKDLEHQQYRLVGNHSAVKICHWTKAMLRYEGECYKHKFYGIMSHQCLQMTTSLSCANRCIFCWRGYKAPVSKEWTGSVDDPKRILDDSIKAHVKLLAGFGGFAKLDKKRYLESKTPKHVALSLTGEPINYPKINLLIDECNKRGISTFLVTNAQYPNEIRKLAPVTQLYLSVDAPSKEILKKVDAPLFKDYWERLIESLKITAKKKQRKAIRLTIIKGINDIEEENYAKLIMLADADFVEVKAYMWVGESRIRLKESNMPLHEEIVAFSRRLAKFLDDYEIVSEHITSRVVLLAKKSFRKKGKWKTWIDFEKWFKLANSDKKPDEIRTSAYLKETPKENLGISGKGTKDRYKEYF